jgi:hypothetical protein
MSLLGSSTAPTNAKPFFLFFLPDGGAGDIAGASCCQVERCQMSVMLERSETACEDLNV